MKKVTHRETIDGCRFDPGDFVLAVRWCERDVADPQGRSFYLYEKGVLNSTELRHHGFQLKQLSRARPNSAQSVASAGDMEALDDDSDDEVPLAALVDYYEMCPNLEQDILSKCW